MDGKPIILEGEGAREVADGVKPGSVGPSEKQAHIKGNHAPRLVKQPRKLKLYRAERRNLRFGRKNRGNTHPAERAILLAAPLNQRLTMIRGLLPITPSGDQI